METKKCPYCGKTVLSISKVCKQCGKTIEENEKLISVEKTRNSTGSGKGRTKKILKLHKMPQSPQYDKQPKPFPWAILVVALVLLLGVGGSVGYYQFYLPYKTDKEAPRFYTYVATNTFLRSSQMSGVEHNVWITENAKTADFDKNTIAEQCVHNLLQIR